MTSLHVVVGNTSMALQYTNPNLGQVSFCGVDELITTMLRQMVSKDIDFKYNVLCIRPHLTIFGMYASGFDMTMHEERFRCVMYEMILPCDAVHLYDAREWTELKTLPDTHLIKRRLEEDDDLLTPSPKRKCT